jgi:hypothetical protein
MLLQYMSKTCNTNVGLVCKCTCNIRGAYVCCIMCLLSRHIVHIVCA